MQFVEANGAKIPAIGLGTSELRGRTCARLVEQALKLGYRHIDTAQVYENEREVGEGLRASRVRRDDIFVTTKVWTTHFAPHDLERSTKESLTKLRLTEVDLLLLHWPNPQVPLAETLGALAHVRKLGMSRHIGVSNFTVALLDEAVAACPEPLVCDQVEYHPYLDQTKVKDACARHGMALVAYSPVAKGRVKSDATLARIGRDHGKTAAQVGRAGWRSRMFARYRRHRGSNGSRKTSRFSTSRCRTRKWARYPGWAAPRAGSPILGSPRNGIEASLAPL
jgi:2,5-diketo-D-gluconate reductase B